MQILVTVEEGGAATAQVLGAAPTQGPAAYAAAAEEAAIDGGAAPDGEEEFEVERVTPTLEVEAEAQDGGAAPPEAESEEESAASMEPLLNDVPPFETEGAFDAGAAPTVLESASSPSVTPPALSVVD
ncbi:MAG: hypothetical protein V3W34_17355 [Phycisphaerae bacterium]